MQPVLIGQTVNLLAAALLLASFAMLSQRRLSTLVNLYGAQGFVLALSAAFVGYAMRQPQLYWSAVLTFGLKVVALPWLLRRLIRRLDARRDIETLFSAPLIMLVGIVLVVLAFNLALPITELTATVTHGTLGIALASVLLSFLMMVTRVAAVPQVVGFLAMENSLVFAATAATYGMPMMTELGIALDVLIGMIVLGVFVFQNRERNDALRIERPSRDHR